MSVDVACSPESCPIVAFSDLTPAEQREQRARKAKEMYERGFTMEVIAKQFDVGKSTIERDLEGLPIVGKPHRPKGGRPKGSGRARKPRDEKRTVEEQAAVRLVLDEGETIERAAAATGLTVQKVKTARTREEGRREAEPTITRDMLPSMTAQKKFDIAIKQEKQKLAVAFQKAVQEKVDQRITEYWLPEHKKLIANAKKWAERRKKWLEKSTFTMILRCLHPDSRKAITDERLAKAFDAFMALKDHVLDEKDSPTLVAPIPNTLQEWDRMRAAGRKVKRGSHDMKRQR